MDFSSPSRLPILSASGISPSSPLSSLHSYTPTNSSPPRLPTSARDTSAYHDEEEGEEEGEEEDEENDTLVPSGSLRARTRGRKLQIVLRALRQARYTVQSFLEAMIEETDHKGQEIVINHRTLGKPSQRQTVVLRALNSPKLLKLCGNPIDIASLRGEFETLRQKPLFGKFDHTMKLEDIDFKAAFDCITQNCPQWDLAIRQLLSNQRSHWDSYAAPPAEKNMHGPIFLITSILCSSQAKKQSNMLYSLLDIYLLGSGVKRRVFSTLAELGLCHSYKAANELMHKIADTAKVCT